MKIFRVFVSSPGDVMIERRRVQDVVSRLNGEFVGVAQFQTVRWETEFYQAHSTFQVQIPRSVECDLVIGILKWRLGTELPADFGETLADGRPYPSGTAYEILTTIEKRQRGDTLPDIYVFRFAGSSPTVAVEDPNRARVEQDWQAVKGFFQEWFVTERGVSKWAVNPYRSEDDFGVQLEKLLRKWAADKVADGRVVRWPIAVKGSPFRGLEAFGALHTTVFFGRRRDVTRAVGMWREAGNRGTPYLLVVGASGSGKSSLVRAGLLPRLTTPGVVQQVDLWRVAVMRPSDSGDPFTALATALMRGEADVPKEELGRGAAVPEIAQGDFRTPADLVEILRHADAAAAIKPALHALDRISMQEQVREGHSRKMRCDLVIVIDQFEELFASPVSDEARGRFFDLLTAFAASGRVWIAATLRADFYARMLAQPALKTLKDLGATYDLSPPDPAELAEIVRGPADAAGLIYETDAATGETLDARLLRDADRPDMLPLVQLALSRLFEGRVAVGSDITLPLGVYDSAGGLKGIIDEVGEKALATLGDDEKARLPRLLRQLAVRVHEESGVSNVGLTIRGVSLVQAAPDSASRKLIDALVAARLLTISGKEADAQVHLAHQRVLENWRRAHAIVVESTDFYRIRAEVDESRRKWTAGHRRSELLLARGLPLAEAESILHRLPEELPPEMRDYIGRSSRRARMLLMLTGVAAALFAIVAAAAIVSRQQAVGARQQAVLAQQEAVHAEEQAIKDRRSAERKSESARRSSEVTTQLVTDVILGLARGQQSDMTEAVLNQTLSGLNEVLQDNASAQAYFARASIYVRKGRIDKAIEDYNDAIELMSVQQAFGELTPQQVAQYYLARGGAYASLGKDDLDRAIADFTTAIQLVPTARDAYTARASAHFKKGDLDQAIVDASEAIKLDHLSFDGYLIRGAVYHDKGDFNRAIADFDAAINIDPRSTDAYRRRGLANRSKSDIDHAIADFGEAIRISPEDKSSYLYRGDAYQSKGEPDRAIADFGEAIRLGPGDKSSYLYRGDAYQSKGELDRAIADYNAALKLDATDADTHVRRGRAHFAKGEMDAAIADYTEAIWLDPKNTYAYSNRAVAYQAKADYAHAIADNDELLRLEPTDAAAWNERCWNRALARQFEQALPDCNESLRLKPDANTFDSRGFVYLQLGAYDKAIADYDEALQLDPKFATSLYGRGTAKQRKGDAAGANADIATAKRIQGNVAEELAKYGLK
jgi:tetratricopeptide (TPR) repeat protein